MAYRLGAMEFNPSRSHRQLLNRWACVVSAMTCSDPYLIVFHSWSRFILHGDLDKSIASGKSSGFAVFNLASVWLFSTVLTQQSYDKRNRTHPNCHLSPHWPVLFIWQREACTQSWRLPIISRFAWHRGLHWQMLQLACFRSFWNLHRILLRSMPCSKSIRKKYITTWGVTRVVSSDFL